MPSKRIRQGRSQAPIRGSEKRRASRAWAARGLAPRSRRGPPEWRRTSRGLRFGYSRKAIELDRFTVGVDDGVRRVRHPVRYRSAPADEGRRNRRASSNEAPRGRPRPLRSAGSRRCPVCRRTSVVIRRTRPIHCPSVPRISGRRFGPTNTSATIAIKMTSLKETPNTRQTLPLVCQRSNRDALRSRALRPRPRERSALRALLQSVDFRSYGSGAHRVAEHDPDEEHAGDVNDVLDGRHGVRSSPWRVEESRPA